MKRHGILCGLCAGAMVTFIGCGREESPSSPPPQALPEATPAAVEPEVTPPSPPPPPSDVTGQDVKREAGEALSTTGQYLKENTSEFVTTMRQKLADMEEEVNGLNDYVAGASEAVQEKYDIMKPVVEERIDQAREKLTQLQNAGAQTNQELEKSFESTWKDVQRALARFKSAISSDDDLDYLDQTLDDSESASDEPMGP